MTFHEVRRSSTRKFTCQAIHILRHTRLPCKTGAETGKEQFPGGTLVEDRWVASQVWSTWATCPSFRLSFHPVKIPIGRWRHLVVHPRADQVPYGRGRNRTEAVNFDFAHIPQFFISADPLIKNLQLVYGDVADEQ